jgi:glutamate dehydrogenase
MAQLDNKKLIKFLALLGREFSKRLSKEKAAQLLSFTKLYYASTPLDELINRNIEDAYGATLSSWNFMQDYSDDSLAKINIYNPDYEHHGWSSTHTIVTILQQDIPFLVDSLRIELNRQNIIIHTMVNRTYQVARDQHGRLQQVSSSEDKGLPKARKESIIYLEIDRRTSQEINSLRTSLQSVFTEVRQVVSHHGKMLEQAKQLVNTLEKTNLKKDNKFQVKSTDISETITFLQWLIEGHFVFLGYSQNQIQETKPAFTTKPGLALGLLDQEVNESLAVDNKELVAERLSATQPLIFAKFAERCRVHRPAYPDYISIKCYDSDGNPIQEHIFLGLLTSAAYTQDPWSIPILRHKVQSVLQQARLPANGHDGKELVQILKNYPRDELFQMSSDELFNASVAILHLQERRTTKLFIRKDSYGSFFTCLVFLPRDVFGTELRLKVQDILCTALGAKDIEFDTRYSDSILVRIRYRIRIDPQHLPDYDITELADGIREAAISWDEQLYDALIESFGEERGNHLAKTYTGAFSASYREDFSPRTAVADISHGEILTAGEELAMSFYHALEEEENIYRFKVFHAGDPLPLSDVLPIIENLGLRVEAARPYAVRRNAARQLWINDFSLVYGDRELIDIQKVKDILQDAFAKTWLGDAENDGFNRLVLAAHLNWRQIAMLRGYAKYLKQIGFPFSQRYIGTTLCKHASTSRLLVALFTLRFMPSRSRTQAEEQKLVSRVLASLETVESLDEDRILRRYLEVIQATLRTNFYQKTNQADYKPYIAFKLDSQAIPEIPLPCPLYEIFVNAPWVEGVHLRSGKVARGGLRWSDRPEDFRTEILGLVKAQQVKNAVIVPAGAKGGFIAKNCQRMVLEKSCWQKVFAAIKPLFVVY